MRVPKLHKFENKANVFLFQLLFAADTKLRNEGKQWTLEPCKTQTRHHGRRHRYNRRCENDNAVEEPPLPGLNKSINKQLHK